MTFVEDQAKAWQEIPKLTRLSDPVPETVNGPGCTMAATEQLRPALPELFAKYDIKTVLDVGCGDWTWMQHVDLSGIDQYIGWDVDPETIAENQRQFGDNPKVSFSVRNLLTVSEIPQVDLIIARQVLIHFPNQYIADVLEKFKKSGSTYLLASHWPTETENHEYVSEGFAYRGYVERTVNLLTPPFEFGRLVDAVNELITDDSMGVLREPPHELALFAIPEPSAPSAPAFHSRAHSADEGMAEGFSFLKTLTTFKERVDAQMQTPQTAGDLVSEDGELNFDAIKRVVAENSRDLGELGKMIRVDYVHHLLDGVAQRMAEETG